MHELFPHADLDATCEAVQRELLARGIPAPDALLLLATGASAWSESLAEGHELALGEIEMVPAPWRGCVLIAGQREGLTLWALDDVGADPRADEGAPPWTAAFPVWLAAAAGASLVVHASAGTSLSRGDASLTSEPPSHPHSPLPTGTLAVVTDHINLSGHSPLTGLGESRLGPLFPDCSELHHIGLRDAVRGACEQLGLDTAEAVAACTLGPALLTPAEQRMLARLGADLAVQGLAAPLIACAHAGISCLALVCVAAAARERPGVQPLLERAEELVPALDRLLHSLLPNIRLAVGTLRREGLE